MILGILGFIYFLCIAAVIRLCGGAGLHKLHDERDIPGCDTDINYSERPYIDRYI
jgi:hypothetical protein